MSSNTTVGVIIAALFAMTSVPCHAQKTLDEDRLLSLLDPSRPVDRRILEAHARVELSPDSAAAHVTLGNAYRDGALVRYARESYERATEVDPENSVAWNNLGLMHQQLGRLKPAISSYRAAVEADPRNAEARYNLAHALYRSGSFDSSVEQMKLALLVNPALGEIAQNPRSFGSKLLLPTRLRLYRESLSAANLPAMNANGSTGLTNAVDAAWLGNITLRAPEPAPPAVEHQRQDQPSPAAPVPPVVEKQAPIAPAPGTVGAAGTEPSPTGEAPDAEPKVPRAVQRGGR